MRFSDVIIRMMLKHMYRLNILARVGMSKGSEHLLKRIHARFESFPIQESPVTPKNVPITPRNAEQGYKAGKSLDENEH
jgi:hypothetical protein